jgi:predicted outer membrane repeat protein
VPSTGFRRLNLLITKKLLQRKISLMKTAFLLMTCFLCAAVTESSGANWQIRPDGTGDFPTIQDAITAAAHGDSVTLTSGVFTGPGNRDVDFLGKGLVVTSESGPGETVVDCGGLGRGFLFTHGEHHQTRLSDITIRNGSGVGAPTRGGGVYCYVASPRIVNVIFENNDAGQGGAIYIYDGDPLISGCSFSGNSAGEGGAVYSEESLLRVTENLITGNTAMVAGGGIRCVGGYIEIQNNEFEGNNAADEGGAISCTLSSGTIEQNNFNNNEATVGGAAFIDGSLTLSVIENGFSENHALDSGGALCSVGTATSIQNNIFVENTADPGPTGRGGGAIALYADAGSEVRLNVLARNSAGYGGGIYGDGPARIEYNTVTENSADVGGGIYVAGGSPIIQNTILSFSGKGTGIECADGVTPSIFCCDVFGNAGGDSYSGADADFNISVDPQFCGPAGTDNFNSIATTSPCLPQNSPCGDHIGAMIEPADCGWSCVCPADTTISSALPVPYVELRGFRIVNFPGSTPAAFDYGLTTTGPGTLSDWGEPAAISGTTAAIAQGGFVEPPPAVLLLPAIRQYQLQLVIYTVSPTGLPAAASQVCTTTVKLQDPLPVTVQVFDAIAVEGAIELSWRIFVEDDDVAGFRVERTSKGRLSAETVSPYPAIAANTRKWRDESVVPGESYRYCLVVILADGEEVVSAEAAAQAAAYTLELFPNLPNPFNPSTKISFTTDRVERVAVEVFDVSGRRIRLLLTGKLDAGLHSVVWNGLDGRGNPVSSGVYFYRLTAGKRVLTRKAIMVK